MSTKSYIIIFIIVIFLFIVMGFVVGTLLGPEDRPQILPEMVIQDEKPTFEIDEVTGRLHQEFPALPVYPGAELEYSFKASRESGTSFEAYWETLDSAPSIVSFYLAELPKVGWQIEPEHPKADINITTELPYQIQNSEYSGLLLIEKSVERPGTIEIIVELLSK